MPGAGDGRDLAHGAEEHQRFHVCPAPDYAYAYAYAL